MKVNQKTIKAAQPHTDTHTHRGSCYKPDIKSEPSQSSEKQDNVTHSSVHMPIPSLEVIFVIP